MQARQTIKLGYNLEGETAQGHLCLAGDDVNAGLPVPSSPELQKARNYRNGHTSSRTWWASPKRNGIKGHMDRGVSMMSREGNRFPGFEAMEKALDDIMADQNLSFIEGELWAPDMTFQEIQGLVRSGSVPAVEKARIELHVFAVGGRFKNTSAMVEAIPHRPEHNIYAMPYLLIRSGQVEAKFMDYVRQGHEGIMLRHPDFPYAPGETDALYKLKPVKEEDFIITGYYEGKGHLAGMLGGVTVEGTVDGFPIKAKVGSGFVKSGAADSRAELWRVREELPGQTMEVEFDDLTDRPIKGYYSLRCPRYGKLKQDRGQAAMGSVSI